MIASAKDADISRPLLENYQLENGKILGAQKRRPRPARIRGLPFSLEVLTLSQRSQGQQPKLT
jgi:hypothetical protein